MMAPVWGNVLSVQYFFVSGRLFFSKRPSGVNRTKTYSNMEIFHLWLSSFCLCIFSYFFVSHLFDCSVKFPESIAVVALRKQWFPIIRASFRQLTDGMKTLTEGYRQVVNTMKDIKHWIELTTVILSTLKAVDWFLFRNPASKKSWWPEHIKRFSCQTDCTLSSAEVRGERHAIRYLHCGVDYESTMFFLKRIIGDSLTRKLGMIQIRRRIDEGSEWTCLKARKCLQWFTGHYFTSNEPSLSWSSIGGWCCILDFFRMVYHSKGYRDHRRRSAASDTKERAGTNFQRVAPLLSSKDSQSISPRSETEVVQER